MTNTTAKSAYQSSFSFFFTHNIISPPLLPFCPPSWVDNVPTANDLPCAINVLELLLSTLLTLLVLYLSLFPLSPCPPMSLI